MLNEANHLECLESQKIQVFIKDSNYPSLREALASWQSTMLSNQALRTLAMMNVWFLNDTKQHLSPTASQRLKTTSVSVVGVVA